MAKAANIGLILGSPATLSNPNSSNAAIGVDTASHLWTLNNAGNVWIPNLTTSITAASAAISATETVVNKPAFCHNGQLQVGGSVKFTLGGTISIGSGTSSITFNFYSGPNGGVGDTLVQRWVISNALSSTATFVFVATYNIRSLTGGSGGYGLFSCTGDTVGGTLGVITPSSGTSVGSGATLISLTCVTSSTPATTLTFQTAITEILCP